MRDIYQRIPDLARRGERAAYCSVVETTGSTPQKPGAKLLILPTFQNIGTLGGGCVEAEARKQAARLMQEGTRKLLDFQLDKDYGWDDGLICGGSMRIFVDLTDRAEDGRIFDEMNRLVAADVPAALATVVETDGAPVGVALGNKLLMGIDGTHIGTLGDANLDAQVLLAAVEALEDNTPLVWKSADKSVAVFVEAMLPQVRLVICGAGHVGAALTRFAAMCDFHVTVIDDRGEYANAQNLPEAHEIVVAGISEALRRMEFDPMTFVVIVTRGHRNDEECLHAVVESDTGYIGMIGSRRKIKLIMDDLEELGVPAERLSAVNAPIGIDISSQTVPEIAVSIVAQLILVRNTRKITSFGEALGCAPHATR